METPQPQKKNWFLRHKILSVILALIVLGAIGAAGSGGNTQTPASNSSTKSSSSSSTANNASSSTTPKIGQPADDGKFQFTITSFQCNVPQIEQPDLSENVVTSGAPFCEMNVSVKDISTVAQSFDSSSQYIYDGSGKQYSVDSTATIAANPTSSQFMEYPTINPGVTLTGVLAFDIPTGTTPSYAMLHDSMASNGVKVNLQK